MNSFISVNNPTQEADEHVQHNVIKQASQSSDIAFGYSSYCWLIITLKWLR